MTEAPNPNLEVGYVDTFVLAADKRTNTNWPLPIYPVEKLLGDSTQEGETMRRVYFQPEEFYPAVVLRPRVNDAPDEYYVIPEHLRAGLWMGDKIQVIVRRRRGLDGSPFCLGIVVQILTPPPQLRARWRDWLAAKRIYQGPHQFDRKNHMIRILTLTHTMFGKGARVSIGAPAKTGKTTLLLKVMEAVQAGPRIIVVLSERPEENMMFKQLLGIPHDPDKPPVWENDRCELFVAPASAGASTRMHNIMLAAKRAEGLAAQGEDVIFIVDSWTKALIDPVHSIAKDAGGTEEGGVNPYAKECITIMLGMAGNSTRGSLTVIGTFLNNGSKKDTTMMMHGRGEGNADIMLSQLLKEHGIYPSIDFDAFVIKTQGLGDIQQTTTDDRFADQWMSEECPWLIDPSQKLQVMRSLRTCLTLIAREEATRGKQAANRDQIASRAMDEKLTRVRTLYAMVNRDAPNREIFANFKLEYFDPSEEEVPVELAEKAGLPVNDPRPLPDAPRKVTKLDQPPGPGQMATTTAEIRRYQAQQAATAARPAPKPPRPPKAKPPIIVDEDASALLYGDPLPSQKAAAVADQLPATTTSTDDDERKAALAAFGVTDAELAELRARDAVPTFGEDDRPQDEETTFAWALARAQADVDDQLIAPTPGGIIAAHVDELDLAFAAFMEQEPSNGDELLTNTEPADEAEPTEPETDTLITFDDRAAEIELDHTLEPFAFTPEDAVLALVGDDENLIEVVEAVVAQPVHDDKGVLLLALLAMDSEPPTTTPVVERRHVASGVLRREPPPPPVGRWSSLLRHVRRIASRLNVL